MSNTGQTAEAIRLRFTGNFLRAQEFTTGSQAGGYPLGSVGLRAGANLSATQLAAITATIRTKGAGGNPDTVRYTLTSPTTAVAADGEAIFRAPDDATLRASTSYFIVFDISRRITDAARRTADDAEDSGGSSGWSIGNEFRDYNKSTSTWSTNTTGQFMIAVYPPPSDPTDAIGNPSITGTAQVGQTVTAGIGTIVDPDGLPTNFPANYTFQWVRVSGGADLDIPGETSSTYTLASADVGKKVKVKVSFTDGLGNVNVPLESVESATVIAAQEDCTTDRGGSDWCTTLTVGVGSPQGGFEFFGYNPDSSPPHGALDDTIIEYGGTNFTVEKIELQVNGGNPSNSRVEVELDAFVPRGTAFDLGGTTFTTEESSEQSVVGRYRWPLPTAMAWLEGQKVTVSLRSPLVLRSATVDGRTLVLNYDETLDDTSVPAASAYAVKVDGNDSTASNVAIDGTRVTLALTSTVTEGQTVTVSYTVPSSNPVQGTAGNYAEALTDQAVTNHTGIVNHPATGRPEIAGTGRHQVGSELRAITDDIADTDGLFHVQWRYRWVRVDGDTEAEIPGATESAYLTRDSDVGKRIKVRVSFSDDLGFLEVRQSEPTSVFIPVLPDVTTLLDTTLTVAENDTLKGCFDYGPSTESCRYRLGEDTFTSIHPVAGGLTLTISSLTLKTLQSYDLFLYFNKKLREYERENLVLLLNERVFRFSRASDRTPISNAEVWTKIRQLTWSEGQKVRLRIKDTYENRQPTGRRRSPAGTGSGTP